MPCACDGYLCSAGRREGAAEKPPSASASAMSSLLAAVEAELVGYAVTRPPQAALVDAREEPEPPPCLREHILPMLNLPTNLPAHFISEKSVKRGDVDPHQNRIYLKDEDGTVLRRLVEILNPEELSSFDQFHHDDDPQPQPAPAKDGIVVEEEQGRAKRMKKAEGNCRGLTVTLVSHCIGAVHARLQGRPSGDAVVITGFRYLEFVRQCHLKENDVVEI